MEASLLCSEGTVGQVKEYARQLHMLVSQYKWIAESYVVEYFVKDHWSRLPPSWQLCLAPLNPPQVAEFVFSDPKSPQSMQPAVWPLSFLAFRAAATSLTLSRSVANPAQLHTPSGRNPKLSHCYRTHVKPKKQHEIERLAEVIHSTCEQVECHHIVDVGSGQGHLSRLLSFGYGHRVTSIEAVDCHVTGAAKFDQEVKAYIEKKFHTVGTHAPAEITSPNHVVCTVHPYITVEEFLSVITDRTQPDHPGRSHSSSRGDYLDNSPLLPMHRVKKIKTGDEESVTVSDKGAPRIKCQLDASDRCKCEQSTINNMQANADKRLLYSEDSASETGSCPRPNCELYPDKHTSHLTRVAGKSLDKFLIAGLHTCGDLGPTMLRTFVECPVAVALASVACCYMRMSFCDKSSFHHKPSKVKMPSSSLSHDNHQHQHHQESISQNLEASQLNCNVSTEVDLSEEPKALDVGFPMSAHVKSLCKDADSLLTFEPLELACHFFEGYQTRLKANDPSLLTQGYRAVLEVLIQEQCFELTQSHEGARRIRKAVGSVKRPYQMDFYSYASSILRKLDLLIDNERIQTLADTLLPQWHKLVTYHSIRQLLAPIIESLVLVDRTLFLLEKGIESSLVPIFDPLLSPRNLVLLALKTLG